MSFPFEKRTELSPGIEQVEQSSFAVILAFVAVLFSSLFISHVFTAESEAKPGVVTKNMAYDPEGFIRPPPIKVSAREDFIRPSPIKISAREASLQGFSETVIPSWGYIYFRESDVLNI